MDNKKDFILVGNQNAITYKEVFPYLRDNKVRMGSQTGIQAMFFEVPEDTPVPDEAKRYVENILHKYYLNRYPFKHNTIQWTSYHNKTRCYLIDGKSKFCVETIIQLKNT
jgi:hypothetical protein